MQEHDRAGSRLVDHPQQTERDPAQVAPVGGGDVFFAATGVTDGDLLAGVRYLGDGHASTESLVMRSRSGTVRKIEARHDQAKLRELVTTGIYG